LAAPAASRSKPSESVTFGDGEALGPVGAESVMVRAPDSFANRLLSEAGALGSRLERRVFCDNGPIVDTPLIDMPGPWCRRRWYTMSSNLHICRRSHPVAALQDQNLAAVCAYTYRDPQNNFLKASTLAACNFIGTPELDRTTSAKSRIYTPGSRTERIDAVG
jgi:hypothetical protein